MEKKLIEASKSAYHAQRNWDTSASIPDNHIETLIEVIKNSPTKQGETHYKTFWTNDSQKINDIYHMTKHFTVTPRMEWLSYTNEDGTTQKEYNVRNSQIKANLLFAFCDDWRDYKVNSLIHAIATPPLIRAFAPELDHTRFKHGVDPRPNNVLHKDGSINPIATIEKEMQRYFSIGCAMGELILAANLLGYKTGICSAFWPDEMKQFFGKDKLRLLVGVGVPHPDKDRTEHEDLLNKDLVAEDRRTGPDDEKWKFPTFKKEMDIIKL